MIITNRTGSGIKLHRDKRGENRTDLREDGNCKPGWRVKETEREEGQRKLFAGRQFNILRLPVEKSYEVQVAVEMQMVNR